MLLDEWVDKQRDSEWMDGWMDSEWMDAWTGGWMAGSSQWQVFLPHFPNFSCLDFFRQPPGQTPGHVTLAAWYHSSVWITIWTCGVSGWPCWVMVVSWAFLPDWLKFGSQAITLLKIHCQALLMGPGCSHQPTAAQKELTDLVPLIFCCSPYGTCDHGETPFLGLVTCSHVWAK